MISAILELGRLLRNRYLPPAELRALQESKLRAIVQHAYENVPYYRTLFRSAGLNPEDIRTLEDLKQIPTTTKEDLRAAGVEGTIARGVDLSFCQRSTGSGTTGKPFHVYHNLQEVRIRRLVGFRALLVAGFGPRDRLCSFYRVPFRPTLLQHLGFFRTENISPMLPVEEQIRRLRHCQPTILRAPANQLRAILNQVDNRLSVIIHPRALITTGEVFDESLKNRILTDIDLEIFNFYMSSEFSDIASECSAHEGLHVSVDQVILEFLRPDGEPVEAGEPGTVVVTSLSAHTMPLLRYRLGDICTWAGRQCSCGSSFPLIDAPIGRDEELIRLRSGKVLSVRGVCNPWNPVEGIDQFRIIQEGLDHLVILLVLWKHPGEEILSQAKSQVLEYLGEPVRVDIQIVDSIQKEPGKFRRFISKLPLSRSRNSGAEIHNMVGATG